MKTATTLDQQEQQHFDALGSQWWAEEGPLATLHQINPTRVSFILQAVAQHFGRQKAMDGQAKPLSGLTILDLGCGGGILAESLAQLGAKVVGLDASSEAIAAAEAHAVQAVKAGRLDKAALSYYAQTVEAYLASHSKMRFDVVIASEVVEHVAEPELFLQTATSLMKKGGMMVVTTLNRTLKSGLLGIVLAEYVLGLVPKGTHDWRKFKKPSEVAEMLSDQGLTLHGSCGLHYNPITKQARLAPDDLSINYMLWFA
jgi:2-polyprenyl-6-hydroxyphenyl methylase/3-demethylubiquinone-9 3-methyltransferase